MKKLILSVSAITGLALAGHAQGYMTFGSTSNSGNGAGPGATTGGLVFLNGLLNTTTDVNLELLVNNGGVFTPVVTLLLSSSNFNTTTNPAAGQIYAAAADITAEHNGTILDPTGSAYQVPGSSPGVAATFEIEGWLGANESSLAAAAAAGLATGTTGTFTETPSGATGPYPGVANMPSLNLTSVPEPSTLAMAGVGLASMLLFRRKIK
jgi:hypothetical protein